MHMFRYFCKRFDRLNFFLVFEASTLLLLLTYRSFSSCRFENKSRISRVTFDFEITRNNSGSNIEIKIPFLSVFLKQHVIYFETRIRYSDLFILLIWSSQSALVRNFLKKTTGKFRKYRSRAVFDLS